MSIKTLEQESNLRSLKKHWAAFSLTGTLLLAAMCAWLYGSWGQAEAIRWFIPAASLFSYLCLTLRRGLVYHYRSGETNLLPTLGAGNLLTLVRGLLIAMLAGFLFAPKPAGIPGWLPALLMFAVAIADIFDGYLARRWNQATRLGEMLDMQLDGLSLLFSTSLAVVYRQVPVWFLLVGLARFFFLAGIAIRNHLGKPLFDLPPSATRRPFAGALMGFTAVILSPLFSPPATYLAAALFALPFLAGFTRDWLVVSGVLPAEKNKLQFPRERKAWIRWLPVALRVFLVAGLIMKMADHITVSPGSLGALSTPGSGSIFGLLLVAAALLAIGAAGRFGAVCALFAFGLQLGNAAPSGTDLFLIIASTALFFLGSGALSAWVPEKRMIEKRLGEKVGLDA